MTVLGKILVLVNLVFSLAAAALVAMMYAPMVDALAKNKKLADEIQVERAAKETYKVSLQKAEADADTRVKDARKDAEALNVQVKADVATLSRKDAELEGVKKNFADSERARKVVEGQLNKREDEVALLETNLKQRDKDYIDTFKKYTDEHQSAVSLKIEVDRLKERNKDVVAQLQEAQQQLAKRPSTSPAGGGSGTATVAAVNPPPESVEGSIRQIDPSGLLALSIGSDSGLQKGHTLYAFRPNYENPSQSKYLGTVEIVAVGPKESVARIKQAAGGQLQQGDHVAASLTPR